MLTMLQRVVTDLKGDLGRWATDGYRDPPSFLKRFLVAKHSRYASKNISFA